MGIRSLFSGLLILLFSTGSIAATRLNVVGIGRGNVIFFSRDGGHTWEKGKSNTRTTILSIVSDHRGNFFAVGPRGALIRSTDGGKSFRTIATPGKLHLAGIAHDGNQNFVVVGSEGTILYSAGGENWQKSASVFDTNYEDVQTDGKGNWIAVGIKGFIVRSTDNGKSWQQVTNLKKGPHLESITVASDGTFYATGARGTVASSHDGGVSWDAIEIDKRFYAEGIAVNSRGELIVVGWRGKIFHSVDGGRSWKAIDSGTKQRLKDVTDAIDGHMVAVGFRGTILFSDDNGMTWKPGKMPRTRKSLETVAFNLMPDLEAGIVKTKSCRLTVEIRNVGTGQIPPVKYRKNIRNFLTVKATGASPIVLDLNAVDQETRLKKPGGKISVPLDVQLTTKKTKVTVDVDGDRKIAELSEGNNHLEKSVSCDRK